jgi:fermentation-respiration switch protein FrsA (DUF1100 family)
MKKLSKYVAIGAASVAAAAGVASVVSRKISKYVVDTALDREKPKQFKAVSISTEDICPENILPLLNDYSEKLKNSNCELVEIYSDDGEKLIGHWQHRDTDKRVIIAMHGWRSSWSNDFGAISDFLMDMDCSILYAEQRGQGESGGKYMGFGMIERFDCLKWIKWVNDTLGGDYPIYLAGISMGASTVLMTAGFELPENVKGIIADCGFTSAHDIWKHVLEDNTYLSYRIHRRAVDEMCKKKISIDSNFYTTLDAMEECKVPVLFVHGTDDKFVPIDMTYRNYKACASKKRLFAVPGASHALSYIVDKEGYEREIKDFFNWQ